MTHYGILVVDLNWANEDSVKIEKAAALRHRDHLIAGTKGLIYVDEPIQAIIAEVEIAGAVIEIEPTPSDLDPVIPANSDAEYDPNRISSAGEATSISVKQRLEKFYRVPIKVLRLKGQAALIPLSRLQVILGKDLTLYDETWFSLSESQYNAIIAAWNKERVT